MLFAQRIVLLLFALSLLAGITTGHQIYYRLTYFFGLLFFGSWVWSWLALRGIRVERKARALRAQVGQIYEERFEVINESRLFRMWIEVKNESTLPDAGGSQVLTLIGGRQKRVYWSQTLLSRRGVFPLGPTVLSSSDLFGLFPVSRVIPAEDSLLVYPMMFELRSFPNPAGLLPGGEALRRRTHQVTPNASGVRDYYPGDSFNRIHWKSSARRDKLIVKEFELDPLAEVWIFLDAYQYEHHSTPYEQAEFNVMEFWRRSIKVQLPPSTGEYAVSATASLARYFLRKGRAVGLVAVGQHNILLSPDRGGRQLGKILEDLAVLQMQGSLPLQGLVEAQAKHVPRGSTVVLITPTIHQEFVYLAEYLLRRGLRPVVVLIEASTFGGPVGSADLAERVQALGVPVRTISYGVDLSAALEESLSRKVFA